MRSLVDAALADQEQRVAVARAVELVSRRKYRCGSPKACVGGCGIMLKANAPFDRCLTCRSK